MRYFCHILIFIGLCSLPLSAHTFSHAIDELSIQEIHQKMQQGKLTSEQLVKFYLKRIEKFDKQLNAVVQINKNALTQAKALDENFIKSGLTGVLHGIPVLLKDNIDTTDGMANTAGSHALKNNFPNDDAFFVQQLKRQEQLF